MSDRDNTPMWEIHRTDCFDWMRACPTNSFTAIVTDPPYSLEDFSRENLEKMKNGNGGLWRIPPSFDGHTRAPLPRFTVFSTDHYKVMYKFFNEWATLAHRILVPGGHIIMATTPIFLPTVSTAIANAGFEPRSIIVRLVQTLRGGFRPKNAEVEFENVSTMPRANWEPWTLLRKPIEENFTIAQNLRKWKAGGLRREPDGKPFPDVIPSGRTPRRERLIAPHPTLKPQSFMRRIARSVLPCEEGVILDPFCGAGSTLAAAESLGYKSVGVEINEEYASVAQNAIPQLARLRINSSSIEKTIHKKGKFVEMTRLLVDE
jgi:site-specific DNA-methyltransferase (adenine-specific)